MRLSPCAAAAMAVAIGALMAMPLAAQPAEALTVTPPPPCIVELKSPLVSWGLAGCGTATSDSADARITSGMRDGDRLRPGVTMVTWTATTISYTVSAQQAVIVVDTVPPALAAPSAVRAEAAGTTTAPDPKFGKVSGLTATGHTTVSCDAPPQLPVGTTRIKCASADAAGNASEVTWAAVVRDTTPPAVTPPAAVTVEATAFLTPSSSVSHGTATATDTVDSSPTVSASMPDALPLGETTVTWIAVDSAGNEASATQAVTVRDTTAPTITAPPDVTYHSRTSVALPKGHGIPEAHDAVDSQLALQSRIPASLPLGTTTVRWTATDSSGNSASDTQTITVTSTGTPEPATVTSSSSVRTLSTPSLDSVGSHLVPLPGNLLLFDSDPNSASSLSLHNFQSDAHVRSVVGSGAKLLTVVPIAKDANDARFAVMCHACEPGTTGTSVYIYDGASTTPVATLRPSTMADDVPRFSGWYHKFMASSGERLFVSHTQHAPDRTLGNSGMIYAYNTTTWALAYELPNPTPLVNDHFGTDIGVYRASDRSKDVLYVTSALNERHMDRSAYNRAGNFTPNAEIQAFNATTGALLATMPSPWENSARNFGSPLVAYDGGFFTMAPLNVAGFQTIKPILHYRDYELAEVIMPPACCTGDITSPLEYRGGLLYMPYWDSANNWRLYAYNATSGSQTGYHGIAALLGGSGAGINRQFAWTGSSVAMSESTVIMRGAAVAIAQPGDLHSLASGSSGDVAYPHVAVREVEPSLLYIEYPAAGTIRLTYDTALDPREVSAGDYEIIEEEYSLLAVRAEGESVTIEYGGGGASARPTHNMVGSISYYGEVAPPAPAPAG